MRLPEENEPRTLKSERIERIAQITSSSEYQFAWDRWTAMTPPDSRRVIVTGKLVSPMVCGMGVDNLYENGLLLHRTYGTPFIPGSTIKGAMRSVLTQMLGFRSHLSDLPPDAPFSKVEKSQALSDDVKQKLQALYQVFGGASEKDGDYGRSPITVHDAWIVPTENHSQAMLDILTPHLSRYYSDRSANPPLPRDIESPIPSHYLAVKIGASFRFVVDLPIHKWSDMVHEILRASLFEGLGAKHSQGYGRFGSLVRETAP